MVMWPTNSPQWAVSACFLCSPLVSLTNTSPTRHVSNWRLPALSEWKRLKIACLTAWRRPPPKHSPGLACIVWCFSRFPARDVESATCPVRRMTTPRVGISVSGAVISYSWGWNASTRGWVWVRGPYHNHQEELVRLISTVYTATIKLNAPCGSEVVSGCLSKWQIYEALKPE